ncbi:MAG TPA: hypothetical protein VMA83_09205 [Solirubrobacteraceae bacterium]|nr:hypothetical protein [Solirubrobacteraceae bacterium]
MQQRLQVGAVISRVFDIYAKEAGIWVPVSAAIIGLPAIIVGVAGHAGNFGLTLLGELILLVAGFVFTGMIVELVASVESKTQTDAGSLLRSVMPVLASLIGVSVVAALGIVIGFIFLIIPGLILITIWSVFAPVVVLERPGGLGALGRSREMVRGNGWQVFGVIVVLYVLVAFVELIAVSIAKAGGTGLTIIVTVVVDVLAAPISSLAAASIYFELKRIEDAPGFVHGDPVGPAEDVGPLQIPEIPDEHTPDL